MMTFTYFQGLPAEMAHLSSTQMSCTLCGRLDQCFALDFALCPELDPDPHRTATDRRAGHFGCFNCLQAGRFEFSHDTEIGMLMDSGLQHFYRSHLPSPPDFPKAAIEELRRTPQYVACQQELWLVHCADFMVYLGAWQPSDFQQKALDGDGRALFLQMAPSFVGLWDWAAGTNPPGSTPPSWNGHAGCYVFQCQHCRALRAHCDCY